jgi:tetratricopeptide (TPR) repeat protein
MGMLGWGKAWLGNFKEGQAICERAIHLAHDINDLHALAFTEFACGWLWLAKGDGKKIVHHLRESIRYCKEIQFIAILGTAYCGVGMGYYFLEDLKNAQMYAEQSIKIHEDAAATYLSSAPHSLLCMVYLDSGDLSSAQRNIEEALVLAQENKEKISEGVAKLWLGRTLGISAKSKGRIAEEYIMQGIKDLDELKLKPWYSPGYLFLGELYAGLGRIEDALQNLRKAEMLFHEMGMDYWLRRAQSALDRLRG